MALNTQVIRNWAAGAKQDAAPPSTNDEEDSPDDAALDPFSMDALQNPIWSGKEDAVADPTTATELVTWLEDHEPELHEALMSAAAAAASTDPNAMTVAAKQLAAAQQFLTPEYPAFDAAQQATLIEQLNLQLAGADEGEVAVEPTLALAKAVLAARQAPVVAEELDSLAAAGAKPGAKVPPKVPAKPGAKPAFGAKPGAKLPPKPTAGKANAKPSAAPPKVGGFGGGR